MLKVLPRGNTSEVGLAEILMALNELRPKKDETRALIVEALGFGWRGIKDMPHSEKASTSIGEISLTAKGFVFTSELKLPSSSSEVHEDFPSAILDPIGHEKPTFEYISDNPILDSIEVLEQTDIKKHMKRPQYQPLIYDRWFRTLMSAMLATQRTSQEINWTVLLRDLAKGLPLERIPFQPRPTMQRGVLVFLDHSNSMQPFWRDEEELLLRLRRLLGKHRVQEWWLEVNQWSKEGPKLEPYSPLPSQLPEMTPLLLVTDFGMEGDISGSPVNLEPWLPLLELARKKSCPVIALVPVPDSGWPEMLRQHIPYSFVWDRETSITKVRRYKRRIG